MRIRDLLAHRSGLGLGAGDLLYWPATDLQRRGSGAPAEGRAAAAAASATQYAYDNILFGVAQQVIEQASGQGYAAFLQSRILGPLGMDETRYNGDDLQPGDKVATGHAASTSRTCSRCRACHLVERRRRGRHVFQRARHGPVDAAAAGRRRDRRRGRQREAAVQRTSASTTCGRWSRRSRWPRRPCRNSRRSSRTSRATAKAGRCPITAATSWSGTPADGRAWCRA